MLKTHLFLCMLLLGTATHAQTVIKTSTYTITVGKNAKQFYKSYEDYKADNPVKGITIGAWQDYASKIEVVENGTKTKVKISELPYQWFINPEGMLMRVFDGDLYYVAVDGPLCLYIKGDEFSVRKSDDGEYHIGVKFTETWPDEYYSVTPTGEIAKLKDGVLDSYLEKYGMKKSYETDPEFKREAKDCVACWQMKKLAKKIKYVRMIGEKMN